VRKKLTALTEPHPRAPLQKASPPFPSPKGEEGASPPYPSPKGEGSKMSDKQYTCDDIKVITDAK